MSYYSPELIDLKWNTHKYLTGFSVDVGSQNVPTGNVLQPETFGYAPRHRPLPRSWGSHDNSAENPLQNHFSRANVGLFPQASRSYPSRETPRWMLSPKVSCVTGAGIYFLFQEVRNSQEWARLPPTGLNSLWTLTVCFCLPRIWRICVRAGAVTSTTQRKGANEDSALRTLSSSSALL